MRSGEGDVRTYRTTKEETMNKWEERFYVERAAEMLKVEWVVGEDRESPDFIIAEGNYQFGLEISELFIGREGRKGAAKKAEESFDQEAIDRYRNIYEGERDIPLCVRILGSVNDEIMDQLLAYLLRHDFGAMSLGDQIVIQPSDHFKAYVTKGLRNWWFRVDDRVGMVNTDPMPIMEVRVARKSENLRRYQEAAGEDVRLLLVANRIMNSGRLKLVEKESLDTRGFRAVYFLSYPENVTVFSSVQCS